MINAGAHKPVIDELIDLTNQQKKLALNLFMSARTAASDKDFLQAIRDYLNSLDDQSENLQKIARMNQVSFENDAFEKLNHHG